jgi:ubiquinone/menaquinone biosynthesis C-methylase UbiE
MLACELSNLIKEKQDPEIIELGCGEGDLTEYLFKVIPNLKLELLDVSVEMITIAKDKLSNHTQSVSFIEKDAAGYLSEVGDNKYDFIISAWTIHNFPWNDKKKLFQQIFNSLKSGGVMLLMDKIYEDDLRAAQLSYDMQINRYKKLGDSVREDMLLHEVHDFSDDYRMSEVQTKKVLEEIGFKNFKVIDRVGRDLVISIEK